MTVINFHKSRRQRVRLTITSISFLLLPITLFYFSPYLVVMGAFNGVVAGCLITFGAQLIGSVFLRRAFCGWLCGAGGLQEMESLFSDKPNGANKKLNVVKYVIWVPWIASIIAGFIVAGGVSAVDPFYHTLYGISVADINGLVIYLVVVLLFFIPNLFLGRRAMCHCICWMAPFMVVGSKFGELLRVPQLRVSVVSDGCTQCGLCTKSCPMSIQVQDIVKDAASLKHAECIQCGACCDVCRKGVLHLGMTRK